MNTGRTWEREKKSHEYILFHNITKSCYFVSNLFLIVQRIFFTFFLSGYYYYFVALLLLLHRKRISVSKNIITFFCFFFYSSECHIIFKKIFSSAKQNTQQPKITEWRKRSKKGKYVKREKKTEIKKIQKYMRKKIEREKEIDKRHHIRYNVFSPFN